MSTFQRDILNPLSEIVRKVELAQEQGWQVQAVETYLNQLNELRERLRGFEDRANKPDSPYGEHMKEKIRNAVTLTEEASRKAEDWIEKALSSNPQPSTVSPNASPPSPEEDEAVAQCDGKRQVVEASSHVEEETLARVQEAARKLREQDERMKAEEKMRQFISADEERRRRDNLRTKQRQELERLRKEKELETQAFRSLITLGRVNHVSGTADFHAKVAAIGNRAYVVDWFANWCGPCKMMVPVFERLASKYHEVVFLTVDTELETNKYLSQTHGIRALPTFEIKAAKKLLKRLEGANATVLEDSIVQAVEVADGAMLEETLVFSTLPEMDDEAVEPNFTERRDQNNHQSENGELQIVITGSKGRVLRTTTLPLSSTVHELYDVVRNSCGCAVALLVWNPLVLDQRRKQSTLQTLGIKNGDKIRLVNKLPTVLIKLKSGERTMPISLQPSSPIALLRARAREFTETSDPKLIYLGQVLSTSQDRTMTLSMLRVASDSTILCQPGGSPRTQHHHIELLNACRDESDPSYVEEEAIAQQRPDFSQLSFIQPVPVWLMAEQKFSFGGKADPEIAHDAFGDVNLREVVWNNRKLHISESDVHKLHIQKGEH